MELIKASATFSPRLLLASGLPRKIIIWSRIKHLLPCSPSVLHRVPLFLCRSEARERPEVGSSRYKRFVISLSLSLFRTRCSFRRAAGVADPRARDWNRLIREKMRGQTLCWIFVRSWRLTNEILRVANRCLRVETVLGAAVSHACCPQDPRNAIFFDLWNSFFRVGGCL